MIERNSFGVRCPHCLGETNVVINKHLDGKVEWSENKAKKSGMKAVLLDNVRSAWNVGSILRSADGFGFSHAYLCGITSTPDVKAVRKTALGADQHVAWSHYKDAVNLVKGLKLEGWKIFVLEEDLRAFPISKYTNTKIPQPTVLIVGSEITGVDPELLDLADGIFYIPMLGQKRSFNVAVAFGVAGYSFSI